MRSQGKVAASAADHHVDKQAIFKMSTDALRSFVSRHGGSATANDKDALLATALGILYQWKAEARRVARAANMSRMTAMQQAPLDVICLDGAEPDVIKSSGATQAAVIKSSGATQAAVIKSSGAPQAVSCTVCFERTHDAQSWPGCSNAHHLCPNCFSDYIAQTWSTRDFGVGVIPELTCCEIGCTAGPFIPQTVAKFATPEAFNVYDEIRSRARECLAIANVRKTLRNSGQSAASASSTSAAKKQKLQEEEEKERIILAEQLSRQLPNARMCPKCSFGPIDHGWCADLSAHHGQRISGSTAKVNNACPKCAFFARRDNEWPKWDGIIRPGHNSSSKANDSSSKANDSSAKASSWRFNQIDTHLYCERQNVRIRLSRESAHVAISTQSGPWRFLPPTERAEFTIPLSERAPPRTGRTTFPSSHGHWILNAKTNAKQIDIRNILLPNYVVSLNEDGYVLEPSITERSARRFTFSETRISWGR